MARLSILTWNVLADNHVRRDWYPNVTDADLIPEVRRRRVLAALSQAPDLVLLQEVEPSLLRVLHTELTDWQWIHASHQGEGVAIGHRGGFESWQELDCGTKRALVADLPCGARVASVHLSWTGPPGAGRRRGLEQLRLVLAARPDLVAGDFNALPDWPESRRMRAAGFTKAGAPGPTCNVNGWCQRLDEVWVRGRVLSAPPLTPIDADTPMPGPLCASDHLPVEVEVSLDVRAERPSLFNGRLF
ncbi:MAG: hypothetical protein GY913_07075 [Proteobacteria bacterium]|nr:hypothetical protein [Pseudomonadota bacterium]MCP4916670.1 hypothetical protein [Pseudomonadota bacterium]